LLVVAIARYDSSSRLASPPATTAKLHKLFLRGALVFMLADQGDRVELPLVRRMPPHCQIHRASDEQAE